MQYFDKNGKEIKAGIKILMEDGSIEMVYDTEYQYVNPNLGINASNASVLFQVGKHHRRRFAEFPFKAFGKVRNVAVAEIVGNFG